MISANDTLFTQLLRTKNLTVILDSIFLIPTLNPSASLSTFLSGKALNPSSSQPFHLYCAKQVNIISDLSNCNSLASLFLCFPSEISSHRAARVVFLKHKSCSITPLLRTLQLLLISLRIESQTLTMASKVLHGIPSSWSDFLLTTAALAYLSVLQLTHQHNWPHDNVSSARAEICFGCCYSLNT